MIKKVLLSGRDIHILLLVTSKSAFEYDEAIDFVQKHDDAPFDSNVEMALPSEAFDDVLESIDNYLANADDYGVPWEKRGEVCGLFERLKTVN